MLTSPTTFDAALVCLATWALVAAAAWAVLLLGAGLLEALTQGRVRGLARVGCPVSWRPVVLALLGAVVAAAGGSPASAATGPGESPAGATGRGEVAATDLLPVPSRPLDTVTTVPTSRSAHRPVVVRAGDSLWSIAEHRLPRGAPPGAVLQLVGALHRANAGAIGPDPDLIHPGLRLRVPPIAEELHR